MLISPSITQNRALGNLTRLCKICSSSLQCLTPTFAQRSLLCAAPLVNTLSPSAHPTDMAFSNSLSTTSVKGVFSFPFYLRYLSQNVYRWTYLHSSTTVPVVPPRHDGYPRFLSAAWPYYAGAISTSVSFFLFSAIWLAGEVRERRSGKAGKAE